MELAEIIHSTFLKVVEEYDPLEIDHNAVEFAVPKDFLLIPEKVSGMLRSLNSKKSSGPEPIPTAILKEMSSLLAPPLTHIFNSALMVTSLHNGNEQMSAQFLTNLVFKIQKKTSGHLLPCWQGILKTP